MRKRIIIGLLVALFELLGVLLLILSFSSAFITPKPLGFGQGLLLVTPFSGDSEQSTKGSAATRKAALVNTTPPAMHTKNVKAHKHSDPPIPLTSEGEAEKLVWDSADALPDNGVSNIPAGAPDGTSNGAQNGAALAGGGDSYDPYAGASPQFRGLSGEGRNDDQRFGAAALSRLVSEWLSGVGHSDQDIVFAFVERLRADVLRLSPRTKGVMDFVIITDQTGQIVDAHTTRCALSSKICEVARKLLLHRTMGSGISGWHALPTLQF